MKTNSTDLHIKYKLETGEDFQWNSDYSGYHSTEGYSREYCKWIEEQYVKLLNEKEQIKDYEESLI